MLTFHDFPEILRALGNDLWANDSGKCLNTCVAMSVSWSVWSSSFIMQDMQQNILHQPCLNQTDFGECIF